MGRRKLNPYLDIPEMNHIINQYNFGQASDPFIITINTALGTGTSFTLPLPSGQVYDFWWNPGDGSPDRYVTAYNDPNATYDYGIAYSGEIRIGTNSGDSMPAISFNNAGDKLKVTGIVSFGDIGLTDISGGFFGCSNITGSLPPFPSTLTVIGGIAFSNCTNLSGSLEINEGITSIETRAFDQSGFDGTLTLPSTLTNIGAYSFIRVNFTGSLNIPNNVTSIGDYAFYDCNSFNGSLTLPSGLTSIKTYAFYNCYGFTGSLNIPNTVTLIGERAFQNCYGFTGSFALPPGITNIGEFTFYNCNGFTGSLTIPDGVTSIGKAAFQNCYGFTGSLTLSSSLISLGGDSLFGAFRSCYGFTGDLTLPSGLTSIQRNVFRDCYGFDGTLTLPSGLTSIESGVFRNCNSISRVDSYPLAAPTVGVDGLLLLGSARPLHIQSTGTSGYGVAPWSDTGIFSTIITDL